MAAQRASTPLTVDQLLEGIKRLPPPSLREFKRRFLTWQNENDHATEPEQAPPDRLSAAEERRLKRLIARSERGLLTPEELAEYRALARRAEQVSATRLQELAELAAPGPGKNSGTKGGAGGP